MLKLDEYPCSDSCATVYFDAWASDGSNADPILSLIYATLKSNSSLVKLSNRKNIAEIIAAIGKTVTGCDFSNLLDKLKGDNPFEGLEKEESIQHMIRRFLNELIEAQGNRLVIFIDELDRCKPDYAIRLLERIKHYFEDDRITFVFSVNLEQLQHTIEAHYGAGFDATRYLDKFFDLHISLAEIDYDCYLRNRFSFMHTSWLFDQVCLMVIKHFKFPFREVERFVLLTRIAFNKESNDSYEIDRLISYFVPYMIALRMKDFEKYKQFISGNDSQEIFDILMQVDDFVNYVAHRYVGKSALDSIKGLELVVSHLRVTYEATFSQARSQKNTLRQESLKIVSLLSSISEYNFE